MNQAEYERRKRQIEGEMEEALELVRTGFRTQLRALEMVWMGSPENRAPVPPLLEPSGERRPVGLPPLAAPPPAAAPPAPPRRRRRGGELYNEVIDLMEGLPEVFDRSDLLGRLNPPPERSSLYKVFQELVYDSVIEQVEGGHGMYPNRYRRLVPLEEEEAQG